MMTANQFLDFGNFAGIGLWGFERDKMLACQTSHMVYQDMEDVDPSLPIMLPADADGPTPPPAGTPAPVVTMNLDLAGLPEDKLQVWHATIDWTGTPSIRSRTKATCKQRRTTRRSASTSPRASRSPERPDAPDALRPAHVPARLPQLRHLGGDDRRPLGRYRRLDHAGVALVRAPTDRRGDWGIREQGTYAPADGINRWMPSVAMDKSGDLAVGYSVSTGRAHYPGVRYAGRLVSDPPNELSQGEATLINGGGSQTAA